MDLTLAPDDAAFADEVRGWLATHMDRPPTFGSVEEEVAWGRQWQATMAADRMVAISWPRDVGGRSATPVQVALYNMEYARAGAPQPVNRVGINLAGPTLLACGDEEQQRRWLPSILDASEIWCQLFSEPDAGSDLASLRTRADRVDGGWLLTGQKVWTSYAQFARWGIALARTDPDASKHRGISYLVVDMESDGIEIRPLHQITDEREFNEVFLEEVFVPDDQVVGGVNDGWRVANTTLAHERGTNFPFKEQVVHEIYLDQLAALAAERGVLDDPLIGDAVADAFVELRLLRLQNWRTLSALGRGEEPGPESSVVKLVWSDMTQHLSALALLVLGDEAPLWPAPTGELAAGTWQRQWLWSKSASIAGGTSEVQRTIIGERMLGLPRG
jgi:alkylation response protein AidB-like acyl-CoA dehydrogenase